jgi:8-oxo-dGTP pyrophosphatase MutT (NUDIX family)
MRATKACPVVLRGQGAQRELLVFEHPVMGTELVKGSIKPGESPRDAALRELHEESGIADARVVADLGDWFSDHGGHVWSFHLCDLDRVLPDTWVHHAAEDGGHLFRFFWHPLHDPSVANWHRVFRDALAFVQRRLPEIDSHRGN